MESAYALLLRSFGDADGFGDVKLVPVLVRRRPRPTVRPRVKDAGFGDASGFGDAGGFDYAAPNRKRPESRSLGA